MINETTPPPGGFAPPFDPEYVVLRRAHYPGIFDFVDAYYWAQRGKPELMEKYLKTIDEVKAQYPKD